jgi:hypothetical protein
MDYNNGFSLSSFFLSLLSFLWIGAQFPQEKFLSYGRIFTLLAVKEFLSRLNYFLSYFLILGSFSLFTGSSHQSAVDNKFLFFLFHFLFLVFLFFSFLVSLNLLNKKCRIHNLINFYLHFLFLWRN